MFAQSTLRNKRSRSAASAALVMDISYSYTLLSSWNGEYVSVNLFAHADVYVV
jgi:hypothetical protein